MNPIAISNLRSNLSNYLHEVKEKQKPLVFWTRNKKEYLILPYPNTDSQEDLFEIYNSLEDKMIQLEYYKGIENNMQDWLQEENDNLFE
jgi:PHD/YefM family antitoxin component YafN of YafNO toxin-antitoxin module